LRLADLDRLDLESRLEDRGLGIRTGPFTVRVQSDIPSVADGLVFHYGQFELWESDFHDFHVSVRRSAGLRRWVSQQANFAFDGFRPFLPLPIDQAFPMLEWGMNWCVSTHANHFLIIHAAVVERNGFVAILPAPPGSGKSTLCAGLVLSGWRLLSDELTLIDPDTGLIYPLSRPVSLKNQSISVIAEFSREARIGVAAHDTAKGTVAHLSPPVDSVCRQQEPARPGWVIFPKWQKDAEAMLTPRSQAQTFIYLAQNAFNYSQLGERGFLTGTGLIRQCECYDFTYHALPDAVHIFNSLADEKKVPA
jgi:hypothetical protein